MLIRKIASLSALGVAFFASISSVATADPLSITSSTPPDSAIIAPQGSFSTISFTVATNVPKISGGLHIELATRNVPGQDGTLANDFVIGTGYLFESDAYPGTYSGTVYVTQAMPAGNYFWQASGNVYQLTSPFRTISYISAPVALNVASPQAAPAPAPTPTPTPIPIPTPAPVPAPSPVQLTLGEANNVVAAIIRRKTHRSPIGGTLRTKCHRRGTTKFVCSPSWLDSHGYIYAGTLTIIEDSDRYRFSFEGARARRSCLAHHAVEACASHVEW
jgi:hypothetical protein